MTTMLIAQNETRESGSFMGDQLCSLKAAYLFVEHAPSGTDRFLMSVSAKNEMGFLWTKFIEKYNVELFYDDFDPGDWSARWQAWDRWRTERRIEGVPFDHYRELYLRIHGRQRQTALCGSERGYGLRNIYSYWWCGQEGNPDELPVEVDWFDDSLVHHPPLEPERDVYISPHCKTQGNVVFTFGFWHDVVHILVNADVSVTVGYDGSFCEDLVGHPFYRRHWGTHEEWMQQVCRHRLVSCGNTGTGWLAAACGVPMVTMEPPNSQMPDHRYRQCGLRNIVEVIDAPDVEYVAQRIIEEVKGKPKTAVRSRRLRQDDITELCLSVTGLSVNPFEKLRLMATHLASVAGLPGDMADLGAYKGATSFIMRRLIPDKHLHVFDTWTGNPYDDPLCHHKRGEWEVSLGECQSLVGNGELTHYHQGVFPILDGDDRRDDTYRPAGEYFFSFVYVDMDTEQATRDAIAFFWPRMVPGGKIVVDDYGWEPCAGVKKAVDESVAGPYRNVIQSLYTCILEKP